MRALSYERRFLANEHWRYFLALEQDLEATTRFVEPVTANFATFSIEFTRLLLSLCSEIDVVAKVLCQKVAPNSKADNIEDYRMALSTAFPKFHTIEVLGTRFGLRTTPWRSWGSGTHPAWWRDHQNVKHARHENFALANLVNCLAAGAGLFALLLYLYKDELFSLRLHPEARLFRLERQPDRLVAGVYELPDFGATAS
jgi:hypothetical protein